MRSTHSDVNDLHVDDDGGFCEADVDDQPKACGEAVEVALLTALAPGASVTFMIIITRLFLNLSLWTISGKILGMLK